MVQYFNSKRKEWAIARKDWTRARQTLSRTNIKPCSSRSCIWSSWCHHLGSKELGKPHPSSFAAYSICSISVGPAPIQAFSFIWQTSHNDGLSTTLELPLQFRPQLHSCAQRCLSGPWHISQPRQPSETLPQAFVTSSLLWILYLWNQYHVDDDDNFCCQLDIFIFPRWNLLWVSLILKAPVLLSQCRTQGFPLTCYCL